MRRFWERVLCKLGHHNWFRVSFVWGGWYECYNCAKRRP